MTLIPTLKQPEMSDEEFRLLRNLVYDECGIWLKDEKKSFLANRTTKRMRAMNVQSYYRYFRLLTEDRKNGKKELLAFMDILTINETSFFRNRPQLDVFADPVLPQVVSEKRERGSLCLNIWSAGCATGEEPYTIAMILRESIPDLDRWKVTILASDLSLTALKAAQDGLYPAEKMEGVERRLVEKYFLKAEGGYRVTDAVKKHVVFDFHNLMHENGSRDFDIIFCRNVLIYFDEPTQKKVIERFHAALVPNGYIFLGHTESLHGVNGNFTFIHHNKGTAYRKKGDGRQ